jgi:hypothetical protein
METIRGSSYGCRRRKVTTRPFAMGISDCGGRCVQRGAALLAHLGWFGVLGSAHPAANH